MKMHSLLLGTCALAALATSAIAFAPFNDLGPVGGDGGDDGDDTREPMMATDADTNKGGDADDRRVPASDEEDTASDKANERVTGTEDPDREEGGAAKTDNDKSNAG